MGINSSTRKIVLVSTVGLCLTLAVIAGNQVGKLIAENTEANARKEINDIVLSRIKSLSIGDTLPEHMFEDLEGDSISLGELLRDKCVLIVVLQGCESCHEEMEELKKAVKSIEDYKYFVFVSWDNPRLLADMKSETGLSSPFLYDHRAAYFAQYDISTSPFNLILNRKREIIDMLAGPMLKEDFEEIIEFNKKAEVASN